MALILAVDPERRQHAALACLARELDGHELLSASSCADALVALDHRSPDLVLLPALLPEAEEGELLSRLRDQAGGTDVRALSIPPLKLPGCRAHLRRRPCIRPGSIRSCTPKITLTAPAEECEPAVFADLIRGYLESAREAAADALAAAAERRPDAGRTASRSPGGCRARHRDLGAHAARQVEARAARRSSSGSRSSTADAWTPHGGRLYPPRPHRTSSGKRPSRSRRVSRIPGDLARSSSAPNDFLSPESDRARTRSTARDG